MSVNKENKGWGDERAPWQREELMQSPQGRLETGRRATENGKRRNTEL